MTTDATRPRRRIGRGITVALIIIVLLAAALVAAEFIARSVVTGTVRSLVVEKVGLPAGHPVDVTVDGVVLPQIIVGRLDEVAVSSDDVALGPLTGDVRVRLADVPVAGDAAASDGDASVRLDQSQLRELLAQLDGFPAETVTVAEPNLDLSTELSVLGVAIPVGVSVTPGASDGDLTLTPTSFRLGGNEIDADTLRGQFGGIADSAVRTRSLCIADQLPAALTLSSLSVQGQDVIAGFGVNGGILVDPALQQNGTCS